MLLNNHPLLDLEHPLCSHLQVSEVCDLLVSAAQRWRWMSIEQKLCREKYFQIQSMPNITKCIDKRFAIKNLGISCLALTFNLNIPKMKTLHAKIDLKERFKVARYHKTYTIFINRSTWTYSSVVKGSSREWKNGFNLCRPFAILHGTEPVSALIGAAYYCCALCYSFCLEFHQSQCHADRVQLLTWASDVHSVFTVLEHLDSDPGPWLRHMCWNGAWAWLLQL